MRAFEFLNEKWSEKYKRSINCGNPKGFSQKAHCAGRKKNEDIKEQEVPAPKKIGRELNHLEDLVFTEPNGAQRAVDILKGLSSPEKKISIKWDGNPTVYWGRDKDGTFRMVGKNNWGREEGKSSSPEELKQFILSRGKGEDWREKFANDMSSMWNIFKKATPEDFVGYVYGDILFHPGKPYSGADGRISFTPNQTTYSVVGNSDIGRRIARSKVAVAAHKVLEYFGDKTGSDFDNPELFSGTNDLLVFGQTYVSTRPAVNADNLGKIITLAKNQESINRFLTPVPGMGSLQNEIYTFVNNQAKTQQLDNLNSESFLNFVNKTPAKAAKIRAHSEKYPGVMNTMFSLIREIMAAKNEVIAELDAAKGDIIATTGGKQGGEGYVSGDDSVKLVPRDRWSPYRAD